MMYRIYKIDNDLYLGMDGGFYKYSKSLEVFININLSDKELYILFKLQELNLYYEIIENPRNIRQ